MFLVGLFFLCLWIVGLVTSHTLGGFIHVLLIFAIVSLLSGMIRGPKVSRLDALRASQPDSTQS